MKNYVINELDIPERVAEHIWEKHRVHRWQVYDVVDDTQTKMNEKSDAKHGRVLIARGRDRSGAPLILFISFIDEKQGLYRLRTARRPDKNEQKKYF